MTEPLTPEAKLREGTEILRTGGGVHLTASDCNAILDTLEKAEREIERLRRELDEQYAAVQHASDLQDEAEAERDQAREENKRLLAILRAIAEPSKTRPPHWPDESVSQLRHIARDALRSHSEQAVTNEPPEDSS